MDINETNISKAKENSQPLNLLQEFYSGNDSELNAILSYTYQQIVLAVAHPEIANLIKKVSITEMEHLNCLGRAIVKNGGKPKFTNASGVPYSTQNIIYCPNILHILKNNALSERRSEQAYMQASNEVDDIKLKELFFALAQDEKKHAEMFERAYQMELRISQQNFSSDTCNLYAPKIDEIEISFDSQGQIDYDLIRPHIISPEIDFTTLKVFGND